MSRRYRHRSHPRHRRIPKLVEQLIKHLALPVKSETCTC